jgi:DNA-binding NtrC family response regulator
VLAQFFADKYADANGVAKKKLSAAAVQRVKSSGWRGNIRELENAMHRAVLISMEDEIEAEAIQGEGMSVDVPMQATGTSGPAPTVQNRGAVESLIGRTIADVERDMILNTLDHCLGNRTHAANILGISIRTLRNKLNEYKDAGADVPNAAGGT